MPRADGAGTMTGERGVVVICGAGAAGMAAAISAARHGAEVCLLEAKSQIGGTVTGALIHTLGGFYDSDGELLSRGLARELAEELIREAGAVRRRIGRTWVLSVAPEAYQAVVLRWLEAEVRIRFCCDTRVTGFAAEGRRIVESEASDPGGAFRLRTKAVVDATGTAEAVRLVDPGLLQADPRRTAGGAIFALRGVAPGTLAFPRGVGIVRALRRAAEEGTLPAHCAKAWLDAGCREDEVYVKLFVPLHDNWRDSEIADGIMASVRETQAAVVEYLRRLPEFAQATIAQTGALGIRDGGRVRGEYVLTAADVRESRKFPDAACRCCWPIEYWDPDQGVALEYLPGRSYYEIPLRSLKLQGFDNLWAAGKCLSADALAQASARVVGSCWSMGEAVGKAIAAC
jgi:hypothetical protein